MIPFICAVSPWSRVSDSSIYLDQIWAIPILPGTVLTGYYGRLLRQTLGLFAVSSWLVSSPGIRCVLTLRWQKIVCLPFLRPIINKVTCSISRFSSLLYSASRTTNHPASTGEDGGIRVGNGKTHTRTFCHIKSASEGYRSDVELNVLDYHGSIALYAPLGQSYKGPIKLDSVNYGTGSNGIVVQVPAAVYLHRHEPSMPAPGGFSTGRSSISTRLVHVDDGWPLNARQKV